MFQSVYEAIETQDRGFIITGSFDSQRDPGRARLGTLKLDQDGVYLWSYEVESTFSYSYGAALDPDGSFVSIGNFFSGVGRKSDMIAAKFSGLGTPLWIKSYGGADH